MILQHAALEVREADVPAEIAFWALLGFVHVDAPADIGAAWVEREGAQIHLFHVEDPVIPPGGHVAVVCADYEAALAALRGAGHAVDPRKERWGAPRCFTRTPAGHKVEVMAAPPAPGGIS